MLEWNSRGGVLIKKGKHKGKPVRSRVPGKFKLKRIHVQGGPWQLMDVPALLHELEDNDVMERLQLTNFILRIQQLRGKFTTADPEVKDLDLSKVPELPPVKKKQYSLLFRTIFFVMDITL